MQIVYLKSNLRKLRKCKLKAKKTKVRRKKTRKKKQRVGGGRVKC